MNDPSDIVSRRKNLQSLRQRRQANRRQIGPGGRQAPMASAGTQGPDLDIDGTDDPSQSALDQRAKRFAIFIMRFLESTNDPAAELISDTGVSRQGLSRLMGFVNERAEQKSGFAAQLSRWLKGFLTRPAVASESVVDGVNVEQLRKLVAFVNRVRDHGIAQGPRAPQRMPVRQRTGGFWTGSADFSAGGADQVALAKPDAENEVPAKASKQPEQETHEEPDESSSPREKGKRPRAKRQTDSARSGRAK